MSGDRVVAADRTFGSGAVTLLGFDPATSWIADGDASRRPALAPAPAAALGRHGLARRRQTDRQRGHQPAQPGAAADRCPARPAAGLHRAHRPGELPRPALDRPTRVGLGHGPDHDRGVHRGLVRDRRAVARLGRDPQRGRDRPRCAGHRRRDHAVLPRDLQPLAGDVPAARGRGRPARRADERRHVRRRRRRATSTCSRATRRGCAT